MKNKIKILPENLANKIAAGEVVQRPESVVKELLENSIDAQAKNIELIVKQAGKSLIQVCDDGIGMSEEDAILCIQKHATSKISSIEDLEAIKTLGFRGEALSSIAAVSQLEIRTETRDEEVGTLIKVEKEGEIFKSKISTSKGTCVIVKNLFYNVPARRKFLKSDSTELKHIIDTFNKIALANPNIAFKFYNNDELIFNYNSGTLEDRIAQIFADNMLDALIKVEEKTEYLSIYGYIGKPSIFRKSKGEQYIFLNGRYVINKNINHAVFNAFENILEKGDYPFFILFLQIDPSRVDVNIHPSKLEVKFDDEKDVYNFVFSVVRKTIASYDLVPSMSFEITNEAEIESKIKFDPFVITQRNDFTDRPKFGRGNDYITDKEIELVFGDLTSGIDKDTENYPLQIEKININLEPNKSIDNRDSEQERGFIIQLHNKYILCQIKTGLMIIDQHVAHERILYEKALNRIDSNLPLSQQLLFPIKIELDPARVDLLKELNPYLEKIGFQIKFISSTKFLIEGVPEDIKSGSEEKILKEIIEEFQINYREKKLEHRDNIAKSFSCKAAIKTGDKLTEDEMRLLIDQLFATSMPYVCPHGRPVLIKIPLSEFDKRFGRT
ncbi:MAG: DNA mismatch repair endonuclease MutL [Ignavibacterium sp.]|nr:DNA mismatch repair endonuclease MutL [Ignavibacterium sp.]MDW8375847.1 DNA mismatch repair endonuclease MutL [Ignavibacteriales bacterium]